MVVESSPRTTADPGSIPYTEVVYPIEVFNQNPIAVIESILKGVEHTLETGEFVDHSGLAQISKYNSDRESIPDNLNFRDPESITEQSNRFFTYQLEKYREGKMKAHEVFYLGLPSGVLKHFLPNIPIVMRQKTARKGFEKKHDVPLDAIKDMPSRISSPIFIFQRNEKTLGILIEIKDTNGKNVCVAIELNKTIHDRNTIVEVNDIRSFHGRDVENIINTLILNNTIRWVNKQKGLDWIHSALHNFKQETPNQDPSNISVTEADFVTATNVIKNFTNPNISTEISVRYRSEDAKKINDQFNKDLQQQIDRILPKGHVYQLGHAGEVLKSAGIPDLPIELAADRLEVKSKREYHSNHPFNLDDIIDLPKVIQDPIAIFDSTKKNGSKVILTELTNNGNNFIVVIKVSNKGIGHSKIKINDLSSSCKCNF